MTSRRWWLLAAVPLRLGLAWREAPSPAVFVASLVPLVGLIGDATERLAGRMPGEPMDLAFTGFEVAAIVLATVITRELIGEGKSNWFEGCLLLGVYAIPAIGFFHLPD